MSAVLYFGFIPTIFKLVISAWVSEWAGKEWLKRGSGGRTNKADLQHSWDQGTICPTSVWDTFNCHPYQANLLSCWGILVSWEGVQVVSHLWLEHWGGKSRRVKFYSQLRLCLQCVLYISEKSNKTLFQIDNAKKCSNNTLLHGRPWVVKVILNYK